METISIVILAGLFLLMLGVTISLLLGRRSRQFSRIILLPVTMLFILTTINSCGDTSLDESLFDAASLGDLAKAKTLLSQGADPNYYFDSTSVLSGAIQYGHTQMVKLLIQKGAKVNTSESAPPLSVAIKEGHANIVRILLQHGASVTKVDTTTGFTPLQAAKVSGNADIKRLLIQAGAKR